MARNTNTRRSKDKKINKTMIIALLAIILIGSGLGLRFLTNNTPDTTAVVVPETKPTAPKSQLPSRPEEVWSYIKELESRTVPTDQRQLENSVQLNEKQKEELKRLAEREKQAEIERAKRAEQAQATQVVQTTQSTQSQTAESVSATTNNNQATTEKIKQQEEAKRQEAARKAAEAKRIEEAKKAELAKKAEAQKAENSKTEQVKKAEPSKASGKFGLQCGAFKNRGQAENLQARLVMIGLNARVNPSTDWNRVVIGPIGDRAATVSVQKKAAEIINCVIIAM